MLPLSVSEILSVRTRRFELNIALQTEYETIIPKNKIREIEFISLNGVNDRRRNENALVNADTNTASELPALWDLKTA